ncbi:MAG: alkaline phosphatase D family protein [Nitrospiraceae bacterium]
MDRTRTSQLAFIVLLALALSQCAPASKAGLPAGSPFAQEDHHADMASVQGLAAGDVASRSAVIWFRTGGPSAARLEWAAEGEPAARSTVVHTTQEHDFTASVPVDELTPGTRYDYRIVMGNGQDLRSAPFTDSSRGTFVTAPSDERASPQTFLWSGDLGGQQRCRRPGAGYAIFDQMLRRDPSFAILLGDLIYSDNLCPSPPNIAGGDFMATSLDEYRAKHRYQREDPPLQRFLAAVPVYAMWDDHEVRNNFSGPREPLMPVGRQALLEYWPIRTPPQEPFRLYRKFRRGADLEIFLLDTRQYRSSNAEKDGPEKTMLGSAQRDWLLDGLAQSTATWKAIVTSVPLSNQKGGTLEVPGNDSWARGGDGTGFQTELGMIVQAVLARRIRNVVWLAGDVHYAQVNAYDPDGDGVSDFHEFICGPLSAGHGRPVPPNPDLRPTTLYSEGGFSNFGAVTVDSAALRLAIIDDRGETRFEQTFPADRQQSNNPLQ